MKVSEKEILSEIKEHRKQLHQRERTEAQNSDEYETDDKLYDFLCEKYNVHPTLDVCATVKNTKCFHFFSLEDNALERDYDKCSCLVHEMEPTELNGEIWCNPPHNKKKINGKWVSQTELFVRWNCHQWEKLNFTIMMIIPANAMCTKFSEECIEGKAEYHPIFKRPRFLVNGKPSKDSARNGYFVVIWRRKTI